MNRYALILALGLCLVFTRLAFASDAPGFELKDLKGKKHSLEDLLDDSKLLLIDFWQVGCKPCNELMPHLQDYYDKYQDDGLEVVIISMDTSLTESQEVTGTLPYMAPEQLQGRPLSHHVDIFSFGVMAYELLTSQKPFPGENGGEILRRQVDRTEFVEPRLINPDIPAPMEKVILRCIETEPVRRYPFIGVMVRDLKAALYV